MGKDKRDTLLGKKISGWLATFVIGVLIIGFGLLPLNINNFTQCPDDATIMPDGSYCIVGAPIGPPIWLVGIIVTAIGGGGLLISKGNK